VRFRKCDTDYLELAAVAAEPALTCGTSKAVENMLGKKFGSSVLAPEFGHVVEIAIIERCQGHLERLVRAADINDNAVRIERLGEEGRIDDEGRPMQRLCRAKNGTVERMGDHDVVADFDGEQGTPLKVGDKLAE